jgi:hypothetical protein
VRGSWFLFLSGLTPGQYTQLITQKLAQTLTNYMRQNSRMY